MPSPSTCAPAIPIPFYAALGEALQRVVQAEVTPLQASPVPVGGCGADTEMGGETFRCLRAVGENEIDSSPANA